MAEQLTFRALVTFAEDLRVESVCCLVFQQKISRFTQWGMGTGLSPELGIAKTGGRGVTPYLSYTAAGTNLLSNSHFPSGSWLRDTNYLTITLLLLSPLITVEAYLARSTGSSCLVAISRSEIFSM